MTKRPDQHQIDQDEAGATDYKSRRQTADQNRQDSPEDDKTKRTNSETPEEAMESRRRKSEQDRADELERARRAQHRDDGREGETE